MVFDVTTVTFWMTLLMDEVIHWLEPYFFLSKICDEILSWVVEIWMKNHLVSDSICNTVTL